MSNKIELSPLMKRVTDEFDVKPIRQIEVKKWAEADGSPLKVFIKPLTLREKSQFIKDVRKFDELQAYVKIIIAKALDAQGKPLFTIKDEPLLLTRADPEALMELGLNIAYGQDKDEAEEPLAEKS